jgi:hypothetical protein
MSNSDLWEILMFLASCLIARRIMLFIGKVFVVADQIERGERRRHQ